MMRVREVAFYKREDIREVVFEKRQGDIREGIIRE